MQYRIVGTNSEGEWRRYLPATTSVFGSVEFAQVQEQHSNREARLIAVEGQVCTIAYPVLLRPISEVADACGLENRWDCVTPEFTGPFGLTAGDAEGWAAAAHEVLTDLGIVSEFMHLHPWNRCEQLLTGGIARLNREVVWIDTTLSDDQLLRHHYTHACRKNLKRAVKENVRVFEATEIGDVREFHRIYCGTMDRTGALASYYFPFEYFVSIFERIRAHSRFVLADWKGQIVGAVLYLHDNENVYSYLGGADYKFQEVRPTNAIVHDMIGWARNAGKRRFILGGGYRPDDGVFRFKASFSQLRANFYTFQRIHDPGAYAALLAGWEKRYQAEPNERYFPGYRSTPPIAAPVAVLAGD